MTTYGLPFVRASGEIAAVLAVGSFLLAAFLVPPQANGVLDVLPDPAANRSINVFQVGKIDRTGAFVGRCTEMCGTYHSMMNFELRAVSPENFAAFLAAKQRGMSTPDALSSIGEKPYAYRTFPFDTKRTADLANN